MPDFDPDFSSSARYEMLRKLALDQLEKGLNFELIPNNEFNALVNQRYQKLLSQDYKKEETKKTSGKIIPNIEMQY